MSRKKHALIVAILFLPGIFCSHPSSPSKKNDIPTVESGTARFTITQEETIGGRKSTGTDDGRCILMFTATGRDTICDTLPADSVVQFVRDDFDASVEWTLTIVSFDSVDSIIYQGSKKFSVDAEDTTEVMVTLSARYRAIAVLFTGYHDSGAALALLIDGSVVADTVLTDACRMIPSY